MHVVASGPERIGDVTCETDRARFLGRGRTVHAPRALDADAPLSGSVGAVLDPIVALRVRLRIEPGRSATVAFTTAVAATREAALQLADRYRDAAAADRALELGAHRSRGGAARSRHRAGRSCALSGAGRSARLSARGPACVAERASSRQSRAVGALVSGNLGRLADRARDDPRTSRDSPACGNCSSRTDTGGRRASVPISSS